ncbi:unnamed protein product [Diatraea saccharalis]|uniref:HRDC domain-containing protein n=1 Tax=Diatraea saccharalis TaxID=40085 RepID=A0A9N9MYP6_9NEOP|nr:unnamed protein product [Diatraea saccharalis]
MNSVLNPEAPEFYPHLTSVTQGGYTKVNKSIRSSNQLPAGASHDLFKTFTDFNVVTCQLGEHVILQSNQILATELPAVKLKCFDNENNMEKIVDANDSLLDRVNVNIDVVNGVNRPSERFLDGLRPQVASWNHAPVIAKIQVGSTMFIGAKNIPRPQLCFKDAIDNSDSLWVPRISDKPNNIKPLALTILYNDEGTAIGYEHPYKVELELYRPPNRFLDPCPEPPFPPPPDDTPLTMVDTEPALDRLIAHLATVDELAVDLEHHSYRTYQGITCLIQITTDEGGDFILDALAIREHLHKLNQIFTDPKKLKVFHGAEHDVLWLQRDFGVYLVGLFDTHQAARALRLPSLSLKHLLMQYCGVNADKKFQLADWRMRPLPAELISYARSDTHYLLYVGRRLRGELCALGTRHLLAVFEQSRHVCLRTYNKEVIRDDSHMPLYMRSKKSFNSQQMAALKLLYKWRDQHARELDESPTYLLPNHMLLSLAEALPRDVQGVAACCSPTPPFVKQQLVTVHRMLLSCRELPLEPQLYQMPSSISSLAHAPQPTAHLHDLTHLPDMGCEIELERWSDATCSPPPFLADVPVFMEPLIPAVPLVSDLNAEAKMFIPPFDRYRKYRALAQIEEIREYKDKEAKIAALGRGDELIKTEVLLKLQQAKTKIENEKKEVIVIEEEPVSEKKAQRKRKMSGEKPPPARPRSPNNIYKNVNYRKFYDDAEKARRQPKMKFKKHK